MGWTRHCGSISLFTLLFLSASHAHASAYIDVFTGIGSIKTPNSFFHDSTLGNTGTGFAGAASFYVPLTKERRFYHFELGLQNRFSSGTDSSTKKNLDMLNTHLAARLEVYRFFLGGGYAPLSFASEKGITGMKPNSGASAYFFEGGAIWRVVPELQIVAMAGYEVAKGKGASNSSSVLSYGLSFRFPLWPKEFGSGGSKAVDWDGFRYPFGIMK